MENNQLGRVYQICDRYESGYGHGLNNDGLDGSKTAHPDPEHQEAYKIGYAAGLKKWAGFPEIE